MQLIGADDILGLLVDIALSIRRLQLGRDRRIDDGAQDLRELCTELPDLSHTRDDDLDSRLGDTCIHRVHRHVVAVEGTPAESQLGEVTRADDGSVVLIRQVHEDLRTLTSLRVLEDDVLHLGIVPDSSKVLHTGLRDIDGA